MRGSLMESNLDEIEMGLADSAVRIITDYAKETDMDFNPAGARDTFTFYQCLEREIYRPKTFLLNDKNVEFETTFQISDYPLSGRDDYRIALKKLHLGDIIISFIVYRVGQYSYYAANATICREDLNAE